MYINYMTIKKNKKKISANNSQNDDTNDTNDNIPQHIKNLSVPQAVSNYYNSHVAYDQNVVQNIILQVATTSEPVDDIISKNGVKPATLRYWRSLSPELLTSWQAAMSHRAHAIADKLGSDIKDLETTVADEDSDPRQQGNKIRAFDIKWRHREWLMSKINREAYGDKVEVDNNITVSPAAEFAKAWQHHQSNQVQADVTILDNNLNRASPAADTSTNSTPPDTD